MVAMTNLEECESKTLANVEALKEIFEAFWLK